MSACTHSFNYPERWVCCPSGSRRRQVTDIRGGRSWSRKHATLTHLSTWIPCQKWLAGKGMMGQEDAVALLRCLVSSVMYICTCKNESFIFSRPKESRDDSCGDCLHLEWNHNGPRPRTVVYFPYSESALLSGNILDCHYFGEHKGKACPVNYW